MSGTTDRFKLKTLESGDDFDEDGYKYTKADREQIDRLLEIGAETHRHTGETSSATNPSLPLELTLDTVGGYIDASERVRYKYTLVDAAGNESAASPEAYVDTPEAITTPSAATLTVSTTGGTHLPGNYFYVLSAYVDFNTSETKALNPAYITVPTTTATNEITLTLPTLPNGASGFNIYRRKPGNTKYFYLASVDMEVATPPETYVDDNTVTADCDRTLPVANTTNSLNSVIVSLPGATPTVPAGYTWRIYRTFVSGDYEDSFLDWVVEETSEGSGVITPEYTDVGAGTTTGSPPAFAQTTDSPSKILLTDVEEVQGYLPPGRNVVPHIATFAKETPQVAEGTYRWICEFERAQIIACRAALGVAPDTDAIIVDVNRYSEADATPTSTTIYTTQANRPQVAVGELIGIRTVPDVVMLYEGDSLTVDVDQADFAGDGAAASLTVSVYMVVQHSNTDVSWAWADE